MVQQSKYIFEGRRVQKLGGSSVAPPEKYWKLGKFWPAARDPWAANTHTRSFGKHMNLGIIVLHCLFYVLCHRIDSHIFLGKLPQQEISTLFVT